MVIASQLRDGMAVRIEGQVFKVLEVEVKAGGGQLGGVVKTKLRNVSSGRLWEPHFRPDERLEDLELDRHTMEFLYSDAENCTFMNPQTYEQVEVPRAILGPGVDFLQPGMAAPVEFFDGRPISVVLPTVAEARIAETAPPIHSGQDNVWKEAKLDNGMPIQVPLFIGPGETVRVDVRTGRYLERVRDKKRSA
jgi:elongation factor P